VAADKNPVISVLDDINEGPLSGVVSNQQNGRSQGEKRRRHT
jgi:hypothetical protein